MRNDYADKSFLSPAVPVSEVVAWIAFLCAIAGLFFLWSWTTLRDEEYARQEWLSEACQPLESGQTAAAEMLADGTVRCAITSRKNGMKIVQRMEFAK